MIELLVICVILFLIAVSAAFYFFAESRGRKEIILNLQDRIVTELAEKREWQNKALFKHGNTPLGFETKERTPVSPVPTHKIMTRGEHESRARSAAEEPEQIVTVGGVNPRRREIITKAEEIINATRD